MKNSYALEIFNDDDLMIMMGAVLERIAQLTRWMADHEECVIYSLSVKGCPPQLRRRMSLDTDLP